MTTLAIYQIDAFTQSVFAGNPAAVVPMDAFLSDDLLQKIALENNLSETAYLVPAGADRWELRWFTPTIEVPLCGHATLASAFLLAEVLGQAGETMTFATRQAGDLVVTREKGGGFAMRLPRRNVDGSGDVDAVAAVLGARPQEVLIIPATDDVTLMAVFATEAEVAALTPDFAAMAGLAARNVIATAPGDSADFVSRMFAPKAGIDEDPVTGSAHCSLAPYWAGRLGKTEFSARQISARGGDLTCRLENDAVTVAGHAVLYLKGEISVPG
ncbi:PhzF family phenazine biosynthesis protein [Aureimonas glaciei]|uniref:Isomerase n=1 Tax=Aureimonas glaciei TaxID=1776957 RepID=A0A917DA26_9HYPH|nr:PhzF family phenazine biosynthesis protein [Aureimonas glaciei]GGD20552.1 putative isomerase [Aureimonas glaciei]